MTWRASFFFLQGRATDIPQTALQVWILPRS